MNRALITILAARGIAAVSLKRMSAWFYTRSVPWEEFGHLSEAERKPYYEYNYRMSRYASHLRDITAFLEHKSRGWWMGPEEPRVFHTTSNIRLLRVIDHHHAIKAGGLS